MSRHTIKNEGRVAIYGFDRPLSEYFVQIWPEGRDSPVHVVSGGAGPVFECLEKYGVTLPDAHRDLMALDLPIPDNAVDGGAIDAAKYDDACGVAPEPDITAIDDPVLNEAIETIDSIIFSGDTFIGRPDLRASMRQYLARWERGLKKFDDVQDE